MTYMNDLIALIKHKLKCYGFDSHSKRKLLILEGIKENVSFRHKTGARGCQSEPTHSSFESIQPIDVYVFVVNVKYTSSS